MRTLLFLFAAAVLLTPGCASKQSGSRIYEGDAPSITYTKQESAGGRLGGR